MIFRFETLFIVLLFCFSQDVVHSNDQVSKMDLATLEKAISLATETSEQSAQQARDGDITSLYLIARELEANELLQEAVPIYHYLADERSHIASHLSLGFLYYNSLNDHQKALHYFIHAGERGPNQSALYNAGRILGEHNNFVPAVAYIQVAARLATTHPEHASEKVTETCVAAFHAISSIIAMRGMGIQESLDIFQYASLDGFPATESNTFELWQKAMTLLKGADSSYIATGNLDLQALQEAVTYLRSIWERDAAQLSPLQAHLLLSHMNDALAALSAVDDDYLPAAGGYAETMALSTFCLQNETLATNEGELDDNSDPPLCFQTSASRAVSYYRRVGDTEAAQRVFELAQTHSSGTTAWKSIYQTPPSFDPKIDSKSIWSNLQIAHQLKAAYSHMKTVLTKELSTIDWLAAATSEVGSDGSIVATAVTMRNNLMPLSLLRSTSERSWLEYGPLYDGSTWDLNLCKYVHTLCRVLRSHESLLCGDRKKNRCGTESIVTLVLIKPGTTVLPHCGPNNQRLTLHWCLNGCSDISLAIGGHALLDYESEGGVIVFDDSFEHSLQHKGEKDVMIASIFLNHPGSTP